MIFAAPHAGRRIPEALAELARVDPRALRSLEDPLVDQLIQGAGVTTLSAVVARAFVDVNRAPEELDPLLVDGGAGRTSRVQAGLGVIPRLTAVGEPIHRRRLSMQEARTWLAEAHAPYHAILAELMHETRARHGRAVLVDWHSMPSQAAEAEARRSGRRPDIVLGDLHGRACDPAVTAKARAVFEEHGRTVALNRPYAGGFVTQTWGRPRDGFHALQVEIDRSMYLDETTLEPRPEFAALKSEVAEVATALLALAPRSAAAE
ncbi:N-formylglutamate amidohydrolase [Brevundimonas sp.]|uniref:N-formylglutamate amidohydrolase n=1 Tax=Brevundimonas sp. TaxID=1871086 RepID=UPI0025F246F0|nr:N-formylglutamate amidohydrolase [Brevundimonas sp.]